MERASRAELINTVHSQKDQLIHYKSKLRDVVSAYKSVCTEKDALEASLSVLSTAAPVEKKPRPKKKGDEAEGGESPESQEEGAQEDNEAQEATDETGPLREQLRTLSIALTTLNQEKNKIEANFIADKKQYLTENEVLQNQLTDERKRTSSQAEGFEAQITDLKSRIRSHQLEREKEQTDHALMLRELQNLLGAERMVKEALEGQLEEVTKALRESEAKVNAGPPVSELYEGQIAELQKELSTLQNRLKAAEVKATQPSPLLLQLQREMGDMKADHHSQVSAEQHKAIECESRLKSQREAAEERVSSLESKLSELSEVVGNYEKLRFQDQQAINKLRERVSQLDMENSALARAATLSPKTEEGEGEEPTQVLERIMHLRKVLKSALGRTEANISLAEVFVEDRNKADEASPLCRRYKEEMEGVKEEFERYKLRAQSVLKNRNKDSGPSKETEILKEQVSELRDKLRMSNFHHQEEVSQYQTKVDNLSKALLAREDNWKETQAQVKANHYKEVSDLEVESTKQRRRTVALLAEKDSEVTELRQRCGQMGGDRMDAWNQSQGSPSEAGQEASEEQEAVSRLLHLPKGSSGDHTNLHLAQEKGRMEVELNGLRKQKRQLEMNFRDLQASSQHDQERLKNQVHDLTECLAEDARSGQREGANVEYIKNVMFKFFTSTADIHGKKKMMIALMTILQFSPEERSKVDHVHARGWWTS